MKRWAAACLVLCACPSGPKPPPVFPANYAATYTEVRNCRPSTEHDLHNVRVLADPLAAQPYSTRASPFPTGAIVLKEEYDFGDTNCSGPILLWSVIQRLDAGTAPTTLDWNWQRVDAQRNVISENQPACYACHKACGTTQAGFESTCENP